MVGFSWFFLPWLAWDLVVCCPWCSLPGFSPPPRSSALPRGMTLDLHPGKARHQETCDPCFSVNLFDYPSLSFSRLSSPKKKCYQWVLKTTLVLFFHIHQWRITYYKHIQHLRHFRFEQQFFHRNNDIPVKSPPSERCPRMPRNSAQRLPSPEPTRLIDYPPGNELTYPTQRGTGGNLRKCRLLGGYWDPSMEMAFGLPIPYPPAGSAFGCSNKRLATRFCVSRYGLDHTHVPAREGIKFLDFTKPTEFSHLHHRRCKRCHLQPEITPNSVCNFIINFRNSPSFHQKWVSCLKILGCKVHQFLTQVNFDGIFSRSPIMSNNRSPCHPNLQPVHTIDLSSDLRRAGNLPAFPTSKYKGTFEGGFSSYLLD